MAAETPSLDTVFCTAIEIASPEERDAYLARACGNDVALKLRVQKLVSAHFRAGGFLKERDCAAGGQDSTPASAATRPDPLTSGSGVQIGPYKLLEQIGEGGMGTVFLAEQSVPVRRQVALKVIKPGMDSRQVIVRFEAERQALALMDHPNIARILDAGTTEGEPGGVSAGRPYFVMELVRGTPITAYCDENRLTLRQRLGLFVSVCRALQHAHQKGVIHRDLKPSNILVAVQDGAAVVKVIDFGIAKAIGQQLTEQTLVTGFIQMIGTPLYMSPEQAGSSNLDADTRSDVYSLGVLLYELLTGTTPFESEALKKAGYDELRRIIREDEPPRPSARLSSLPGESLSTVASCRDLEPAKLSGLVRGELDWIVMKSLEKDRHRRYESAGAFAQDVERYLNDESVQACPPSAGYLLRKFVRRNKRAVATATLLGVMLLVAVGAVAGSIGWVAREQASRQAVVAAEVTQALQEVERLAGNSRWDEALNVARHAWALLASSGDGASLGRQVQEHLDDLKLLVEIEQIRLGQAEFDVQRNSFALQKALPDYARAFAEWGIAVGKTVPEQAARRLQDRPEPIRNALLEGLYDWYFVAAGDQRAESAWLGQVLAQGDSDPWRRSLREALKQYDLAPLQRLAEEVEVARQSPAVLANLGQTLSSRGAVSSAIRLLRRAQGQYPGDFWINERLGRTLHDSHFAEAIRFHWIAVALRPSGIGYLNLGVCLAATGELDTAIAAYHKGLALAPNCPNLHNTLGEALARKGLLDQAIAAYKEAIRHRPDFALAHDNLLGVLERKGQLEQAFVLYQEFFPPDSKSATAYYHFGNSLWRTGHVDQAILVLQQALERMARNRLDSPLDLLHLTELNEAGWHLFVSRAPALRNPEQARQLAERAMRVSHHHLEVLFQHAARLLLSGDRIAYRRLCSQSLERLGQTSDPRTAYLLARLCSLDREPCADPERVTQLAQQALDVGPRPEYLHTVGLAEYRAGRCHEAIRRFQQSLDWKPWWFGGINNWLGMALALGKAGQGTEARKWLENVRRASAKYPIDRNFTMHPHDRIAYRLLLREVEELLGK